MRKEELRKVEGGDFGISVGAALAIAGAAIYVYNNVGDFIDGVKAGYAAQRESFA